MDYCTRFGKELQQEVGDALEHLKDKPKASMMAKLRSIGGLVMRGNSAVDQMKLSDEERARRTAALQQEASALAILIDPSSIGPPTPRRAQPPPLGPPNPRPAEPSARAEPRTDGATPGTDGATPGATPAAGRPRTTTTS